MNNKIDKIEAKEILDSRGNPTIEVTVSAADISGSFSVPSGASTGMHEACELRDPDGHMSRAIENIHNIIAPALVGMDITDQRTIDETMIKLDGTPNKKNLGANAILGVSVAVAKTAALVLEIPLYAYLRKLSGMKDSMIVPYLFMNLINGGKHAENGLAFQEYHVVIDTTDAGEAMELGEKIQSELVSILTKKNGVAPALGDEGGLAPEMTDVREPLVYLKEAVLNLGINHKTKFALDVAASSFHLPARALATEGENGKYKIGDKDFTTDELLSLYESLIKEFGIFSIEDPFDEEDFESFAKLRELFPELHVVGDDLTVTNKARLEIAVKNKSINTMIVKPNQIGTLTETLETMEYAASNSIKLIVSHRSGDTMDDFIADLAYAFGAFGLKAGSPIAKERRIKYDRLVNISKT